MENFSPSPIENNYPQPDPAWDYYAVYQQACAAHTALTKLLVYMNSEACETATAISDNSICQFLNEAQTAITQADYALPTQGIKTDEFLPSSQPPETYN